MAKDNAVKNTEKEKGDAASTGKAGLFFWLILAAVVVACATGGFALSQLLGGQDISAAAKPNTPSPAQEKGFEDLLAEQVNGNSPWIYDAMEPVLANLDEPGVTRYVRVTISLEVSPKLDQEKGKAFLEQRTMILRDWLTTYFAGLSLEDVRGSRNLNRIKRDVHEQFNRLLFPDSKPYIRQVLFKEFAVQ